MNAPPPSFDEVKSLLLELKNKRVILLKMIAFLRQLLEEDPRDERDGG